MLTIVKKFVDIRKPGQVQCIDNDMLLLQDCLNKLSKWTKSWKLPSMLKMNGHAPRPKTTFILHGGWTVSCYKGRARHLGDGCKYVKILCTVCQGSLAQLTQYPLVQLTRAFQYRDRRTLNGLYKQYVLPHLDFAVQAWFPWTSKDKVVLENVQKRAIKMVPGRLILQGRSRWAEYDHTRGKKASAGQRTSV